MTGEELYELLDARRRELGYSQAQASALAGGKWTSGAFQSMKSGSDPSIQRVAKLAEALGYEVYVGPRRGTGFQEQNVSFRRKDDAPPDFVVLPYIAESPEDGLQSPLALDTKYIEAMGCKPDDLAVVKALEEFPMEGIALGDLIIIDQSCRLPEDGKAFVVFTGLTSGAIVTQLFQGAEGFIAMHSGPRAKARRLDLTKPGARILGKVVFFVAHHDGCGPI